jgi:hypothetical protein
MGSGDFLCRSPDIDIAENFFPIVNVCRSPDIFHS